MDNNIVQTVFDTLEARTDEISKDIAERDKLEEKIKSGRYSPQALKDDIYPKRDALRRKIETASEGAIQEARNLVAQYRADAAELNNLDPAELTDDVKLLQSGITLLPRDIQGILKRNAGNRTMTQIVLRYAKEHNIDMGGTYYIGGQAEEENARNLDGILSYYKKWIDKPQAKDMLYRFFNVTPE